MQISVNIQADIDTVGEVVQKIFSVSKIRICITAFLRKITDRIVKFSTSHGDGQEFVLNCSFEIPFQSKYSD